MSEENPIKQLDKRAKQFPLLSRELEHLLVTALQCGNLPQKFNCCSRHRVLSKRPGEVLYDHNIGLIKDIAKKYFNKGLEEEEVLQEGAVGFLKGCEKFRPSTGNKLSTYTTWWIHQGCSRAVKNKGRAIRIPIHQHTEIVKMQKEYRSFTENNGRQPTQSELVQITGMSLKAVKRLHTCVKEIASLNEEVGDVTRLDLEKAPDTSEPDARIDESMDRIEMYRLLSTLSEEDRKLIMLYYGFLDEGDKTENDVSQMLDKSSVEVRKRVRGIIAVLRRRGNYTKMNRSFYTNLVLKSLGDESSIAELPFVLDEFLHMTPEQIEIVMKSPVPIHIAKVITATDPRKYKRGKEVPPGKILLQNAEAIKDILEEIGVKVSFMRV